MNIKELLELESIEKLALPSNVRYGNAIFERGGVEIIKQTHEHIEARVGGLSGNSAEGGGQRRRVTFTATSKGLEWNCAGNPKNHQIFCKHCVALACYTKRVNRRD